MREHDLEVEVEGNLIVVSRLATQFIAIYARPTAPIDPEEAHRE